MEKQGRKIRVEEKKKVYNKQGIGVPLKEMRYKLTADPRKKNE